MPCETTGILSRHPPQSSITSKCKNRLCRKQNEAYPFIQEIPCTHPENSADENSRSIGNITCLSLANPCGLRIRCLCQNKQHGASSRPLGDGAEPISECARCTHNAECF